MITWYCLYPYFVCVVGNVVSGFLVIHVSQGSVVQKVDTLYQLESDLRYALDKVLPSLNNSGQVCSQEYMYVEQF